MKALMTSLLLAGVVAILPNPQPADAQQDRLAGCMAEAITTCDDEFQGWDPYMTAIRGYCYMIRTGMCLAFEPT
jgi:hypothetical protein